MKLVRGKVSWERKAGGSVSVDYGPRDCLLMQIVLAWTGHSKLCTCLWRCELAHTPLTTGFCSRVHFRALLESLEEQCHFRTQKDGGKSAQARFLISRSWGHTSLSFLVSQVTFCWDKSTKGPPKVRPLLFLKTFYKYLVLMVLLKRLLLGHDLKCLLLPHPWFCWKAVPRDIF